MANGLSSADASTFRPTLIRVMSLQLVTLFLLGLLQLIYAS